MWTRHQGGGSDVIRGSAIGAPALDEFTLRVGRPVGPMLAQTATGVADALERLADLAQNLGGAFA